LDEQKLRGARWEGRRQRAVRVLPPRSGDGTIGPAMRPLVPETADSTRRELHSQVLRFVSRRVRSREDAEDIAQEVMLRIHRHSAELEHADRLAAWMYRVAANAIADHYRRPARREVPSGQATEVPGLDAQAAIPVSLEPGPDDLREMLAGCLAPLLERLPSIYREALELTEFEAISQVDAAARLGLSVSGMKARVQRGRHQLRELLLDCCHVELDARRAVTDVRSKGSTCGTCGAPLERV
jgi:RNA polymerase sigma-70 factor, ECF subfamily